MSTTGASRHSSRGGDAWRLAAACCGAVFVTGLMLGPLEQLFESDSSIDSALLQDIVVRARGGGPAKGFHTKILSIPPGADIMIQGKARGQTPFFGNVQCRNGEEVTIEISTKGFLPWVRNPQCREGGSLEINARLKESP